MGFPNGTGKVTLPHCARKHRRVARTLSVMPPPSIAISHATALRLAAVIVVAEVASAGGVATRAGCR